VSSCRRAGHDHVGRSGTTGTGLGTDRQARWPGAVFARVRGRTTPETTRNNGNALLLKS
jgi:hypothetical protein